VAELETLKVLAPSYVADLPHMETKLSSYLRDPIGCNEEVPAFRLGHRILVVRMECQGEGTRQTPRRRCPSERAHSGAQATCVSIGRRGELHPNGGASVIFVLHFSFGERGLVENAPVYRLQTAIDVTLPKEGDKGIRDAGLVLIAHRQVGVVPPAE